MVTVIGDPYYSDENVLSRRMDTMGYGGTYDIRLEDGILFLYVQNVLIGDVLSMLRLVDEDLQQAIVETLAFDKKAKEGRG